MYNPHKIGDKYYTCSWDTDETPFLHHADENGMECWEIVSVHPLSKIIPGPQSEFMFIVFLKHVECGWTLVAESSSSGAHYLKECELRINDKLEIEFVEYPCGHERKFFSYKSLAELEARLSHMRSLIVDHQSNYQLPWQYNDAEKIKALLDEYINERFTLGQYDENSYKPIPNEESYYVEG